MLVLFNYEIIEVACEIKLVAVRVESLSNQLFFYVKLQTWLAKDFPAPEAKVKIDASLWMKR